MGAPTEHYVSIEWGLSLRLKGFPDSLEWQSPFPTQKDAVFYLRANADVYEGKLIYREIGPWREKN